MPNSIWSGLRLGLYHLRSYAPLVESEYEAQAVVLRQIVIALGSEDRAVWRPDGVIDFETGPGTGNGVSVVLFAAEEKPRLEVALGALGIWRPARPGSSCPWPISIARNRGTAAADRRRQEIVFTPVGQQNAKPGCLLEAPAPYHAKLPHCFREVIPLWKEGTLRLWIYENRHGTIDWDHWRGSWRNDRGAGHLE